MPTFAPRNATLPMTALLQTPETTQRVHFQDCDMLGHLNNARYLDYFLNAREDHTTAHYALNMGELAREQHAAWVITKHHLSYLKPARQGVQVRILSQLIHFDNSNLVLEMQMRDEAGTRLLALLWSEMTFVAMPAGTRADHSNALMDLLDQLDVEDVSYDPDGFDDRVKTVRQQLKQLRRRAGAAD
ncbi:MAG: acyl-CoA thioesterase [Hymenobacter sp.]